MGNWRRMLARVMPITRVIPRGLYGLRAEVLPTQRKLRSARQVAIPSSGFRQRSCWGRGYDLIHKASPAPIPRAEATR
jgi:hypothetical protein